MTDSAEIARPKVEAAQAVAEAVAAKTTVAQAAFDTTIASTPASVVGQAGESRITDASGEPPTQAVDAAISARLAVAAEQPQQSVQEPVQDLASAWAETAATADQAPGSQEIEETGYTAQVRSGCSFSFLTLPMGTYLDTLSGSEPAAAKDLSVGIPLGLFNWRAPVAGTTGTGRIRTLQFLAEGLSAAGAPALLADVRGDLTGLAEVGASNDKIASRIASTGQDWTGQSLPIELSNLGGSDSGAGINGTPIRTMVAEFKPILLLRVLGLSDTQASTLQLVFHWADSQGLALLDLKDLHAVVDYLTNTEAGKEEFRIIGGVPTATVGVILREIAVLEAIGGEASFGEPALDVHDLTRVSPDGRGTISALELADIQSQGTLFSISLMWLLAEFFETLSEVGDPDKSIMVFFFDEAHLLFSGASRAFLEAVVRTVRLIRSKGVGIVFITQSPTDVPDEVLVQLGSRVQHALCAHAPADAADLKKAVSILPVSPADLNRVLTSLGIGQVVASVLDEKGRPAPMVPMVINVPAAVMGPAQDGTVSQVLASSPLKLKYATNVNNEPAYELPAQRVQADAEAVGTARAAEKQAKTDAAVQKTLEKEAACQVTQRQKEAERLEREAVKEAQRRRREAERVAERRKREVEKTIGSMGC